MTANFSDLLKTQASDVEAPVPLPEGTYKAIITGHEFGQSSKKKTPFVEFQCRPTEAMDDVDEDQFEAFGGQEKLTEKTLNHTLYITENSLFMLSSFLEDACQLDTEGKSLEELIPEATNQEVMLYISQSTSDDGERVYSNIQRVTAVED